MQRSKPKNILYFCKTWEDFNSYKKQRKICVKLKKTKQNKKQN